MLNLQLRSEFLAAQTPGTAIALRRSDGSGAIERPPQDILEITYPTADIQTALRALSTTRPAKPVVLLGDRGRGKSHILAVMHHATMSPDVVEQWARGWGVQAQSQVLQTLTLQRGFHAVSEVVLNNEYPLLWELLFDRHPRGAFFKGKFTQGGHPYPPRSLLEEMFAAQPIVLVLDEFQKWFDGLPATGPNGIPYKEVASGFVQILSELASDRPDLLTLVISVLNNNTDAFQQVHRNAPIIVNFQGPTAKHDRLLLLLHRLFANRAQISNNEVQGLVATYARERYRLRFSHLSGAEQNRILEEVAASWPFAPELIDLLEDQVLMAQAAQETRDLIRILAAAFRGRGELVPLLTPADFFVDQDTCGVQALLESIAAHGVQEELLQIAQRNLESLTAQGSTTTHSREIISALWMRSMSPGRYAGGTRADLQLDVTRDAPIDDNAFLDELLKVKDGSINIHGSDDLQGRLWFGREENAKTKVRSTARNDRLWIAGSAGSTSTSYPGKDVEHIRNTLRHILVPETRQAVSRVVVLGPDWENDPWSGLDAADQPAGWTQPVLIVIPSPIDGAPNQIDRTLGTWLVRHVPAKRNTVRFLLSTAGGRGVYADRDLLFAARCSYLTSQAWRDDPQYRGLRDEFDRPLRDELRTRFDRFAVLNTWNFRQPEQCRFDAERLDGQLVRDKGSIPLAVDEQVRRDLFDPNEFERRVIDYARNSQEVSKLIDDLKEPPPNPTNTAIPFLGETFLCEEVLKVAANGRVVLNVAGSWVARLPEHADQEEALRYIRPKAFRGTQEMRQVTLVMPAAAGSTAVSGPTIPTTPTIPGSLFPPAGTGAQTPGATTLPVQPQGTGSTAVGPTTPTTTGGTAPSVPAEVCSTPTPTSIVNLIGSFDQWGVPSDASLDSVRLEFEGMTVQQAKALIQRLPSNLRAKLEVAFRRNNPQ